MAILKRFTTPGRVPDGKPAAWNELVKGLVSAFDRDFKQFYDQTASDG